MARVPFSENDFSELLAAASVPIYVLDDSRRIRYGNPAFFAWTGVASKELLGQRCDYHSGSLSENIEGVAAGLCPAPESLAGKRLRCVVACRRPDGQLARRWGDFLPLSDDPVDCPGVVAILEAADIGDLTDPAPQDDREPSPTELHDLVRTIGHAARQQFSLRQLIGDSHTIRRVRAQVKLAIQSRSHVMITGPEGKDHNRHCSAATRFPARSTT